MIQTELIDIVKQVTPEPASKFFLIAYYPLRGGWWTLFPELYNDADPKMQRKIDRLRKNHWQHITVCRLPDGLGQGEVKRRSCPYLEGAGIVKE